MASNIKKPTANDVTEQLKKIKAAISDKVKSGDLTPAQATEKTAKANAMMRERIKSLGPKEDTMRSLAKEMSDKHQKLRVEKRGMDVDALKEKRLSKHLAREGGEEAAESASKKLAAKVSNLKNLAGKGVANVGKGIAKSAGKKAAGLAVMGLLGKALAPGVALAGEALDSPAAGIPVNRDIAGGIKRGKMPSKLADAGQGALSDIQKLILKRKKRKNLVEE